jgi:hypothetical protein
VARRIRSIENSSDLIENQTRDPLVGTIVSRPSTLPRAPPHIDIYFKLNLMI